MRFETRHNNKNAPDKGRGSLQREAYHRLREMIIHEELAPGAKVSELELSKATGLGRAPVRAALGLLASDGLVRIIPQRGVIITEVDLETQLKILEVRAELERLLVRLATERANVTQREIFWNLSQQMSQVTDQVDQIRFLNFLLRIHETLLDAAGNVILADAMDRIFALSRHFWFSHRRDFVGLRHSALLHARRLRFISEGHTEKAMKACDDLIENLNQFVKKIRNDRADKSTGMHA